MPAQKQYYIMHIQGPGHDLYWDAAQADWDLKEKATIYTQEEVMTEGFALPHMGVLLSLPE